VFVEKEGDTTVVFVGRVVDDNRTSQTIPHSHIDNRRYPIKKITLVVSYGLKEWEEDTDSCLEGDILQPC
jgi:hypothetical protein